MTLQPEKDAIEKANALKSKMTGKGWKIRVWQNLGWHYSIYSGNVAIHPACAFKTKKYFACVSNLTDDPPVSALALWHEVKLFENPNDAAEHAVKKAREAVAELNRAVEFAEKSIQ